MSSYYKKQMTSYRPVRTVLGSTSRQQIAKQGNFRPEKTILGLTGLFSPSAQNWDWKQFGEGAFLGGFIGGLTSLAVNTVLDAAMGKKMELRMLGPDEIEPAKFASTLPGRTLQGMALGGFIGGVVATTNLACPESGAASQSIDILVSSPTAQPAPESGQATPAAFSTSESGMLVPSEAEAGYQVDTTIPLRVVNDPNMVYYP